MNLSTRKSRFAGPVALLLVAAALRFYGLGWGLPQVYEESQPFRLAWSMWGWEGRTFDPNPHFFNYPSLYIYVQLVGQGLVFLFMRASGMIASVLDYRVQYILDPTPFYMMGRAITAVCGVATTYVTYALGRRIGGRSVAMAAALLVAVNTSHISKSQVIEVDVPLTFLVILSLWLAARILDGPSRRAYIITGVAMGLAVSTKYTAAMLLFPLLVAHLVARRGASGKPPWGHLGLAIVVAVVAFAVTSPYVFLDAKTFLRDLSLERQHMQMGHFGSDTSSTGAFYVQALGSRILGWPLALLGLLGAVWLAGARRRPWAIVLAAFLVPYAAAVTSWSMKADRYLLPLLPVVALLAAGALVEAFRYGGLARVSGGYRTGLVALASLVLAVPALARLPEHLERLRPDTRTEAKRWVEANIRPGSYILEEHYGPELFGPLALRRLDEDVRRELLKRRDTPFYAVQMLPLLQVRPERSAAFYEVSLYEDADAVITSSDVRGRYVNEPDRFRDQVAFYDELERGFDKALELRSEDMTGPSITIYVNPRQSVPFARRGSVAGPRSVAAPPARERGVSRGEEFFFENLGLNYEAFGYREMALAAYELAFRYPITTPPVYKSLVLGRVRCLLALRRSAQAVQVLETGAASTPSEADRVEFLRLKQAILSGAPAPPADSL